MYDPTSGTIVLLSDSSDAAISGLRAEDFSIALRLAYSESPGETAFSLDPADPTNPKGPWLQKVYYPDGVLAGTDFGRALFEADWLLKQYAFGVVAEQGKPQRIRTSAVAGYKSVAALSLAQELTGDQPTTMARFWIVSGEMKIRRDGSSIVFDKASMGVKTKRQVISQNSKTGLSDDDRVKDPINEEFARRFTEHYDELAAESPELERVRELAKVVAIAKWLRQNNIPLDLSGMDLDGMALQTADPEAHHKVLALSTRFKKVKQTVVHKDNQEGVSTSTRELYLFGGVDLKSSPEYQSDASLGELQKAVQIKLKQVDEPRFEVDYGGRRWTGTVLPLSHEALAHRAHATSFIRDGNIYRVDSQRRVVEMVDKVGNRARYRDVPNGVTSVVEIAGKDGWYAVAQPLKSGSSLQLRTARGNEIGILSDPAGAVQSISVDGKVWAEYHKRGTGGVVRLDQGRYVELLTYDSVGRLTDYQLQCQNDAGQRFTESAKVTYSFNGVPASLSGTGILETHWKYDDSGRVAQFGSSDGTSILASYDDEASRTTLERRTAVDGAPSDALLAKLVFENNRLLSSDFPQTGKGDYK